MKFGNVMHIFSMAATVVSFAIMAYCFIKSLDEKVGENNEEKNRAYTEKIQTWAAFAIAFAFCSFISLIIFPT